MGVVEKIRAFVAAPDQAPETFEALALEAFAYQFERSRPLRTLCERRTLLPARLRSWREMPLVPAAAFATLELATDPPLETFRSSGTLDSRRSVHYHPFPDLYRAVVDATFPAHCLPRGDRPPMLALVAPRTVAPDSSLAFMIDRIVTQFGGTGTAYGFGARGVEVGRCRSWLAAHQRQGKPVLLLATALALAHLIDFLERMNLRFRLPAGSAIFETGGFKGRTKAIERADLVARSATWLGIPAAAMVSEYGMTELTSQAYTRTLAGDGSGRFFAPPWLKVRALDPVTLDELKAGTTGLLALFDLANVGSALHLLTEDLGRTDGDGFRLDGRATGAQLRGCSLLAEELAL